LLQFAVDQRYDDYTPVDHAVWRFIMRQNVFSPRIRAQSLFPGLLRHGISFDRIPRIQEMNDILARFDWGRGRSGRIHSAGRVHEFQAYKFWYRVRHAPDPPHRNTRPRPTSFMKPPGHAPIIVDGEYSNYLQRFGEVGARAMQSKKGFRALSSDPATCDLEGATEQRIQKKSRRQPSWSSIGKNFGRTVEMALPLASALVDGGIRTYRNARESENLRGRSALFRLANRSVVWKRT